MKRWLADTLFKRLFALMWLALVVSHAVAFLVVTHNVNMPAGGPLPTFPSLPPFPGMRGPDQGPPAIDPARERGPLPDWQGRPGPGAGGFPGGPRAAREAPEDLLQPDPAARPRPGDSGSRPEQSAGGLPTSMVLLDYGIRFVIIGAAAWLGALWLARPMRRLAAASRTLSQSLTRNGVPPQVDERRGTVEVREAAQVFNEMSRQLSEQVNARALLVAAISHDLRTPLTRIRMRLEANENDPLTMRSIADVHEMDDLIESALEVFRGPDHEEATQVTDVLALVQSLVDDLADLGQPATVTGRPALAAVHPVGLRRVVSNLVNNALRYGKCAEVDVCTHYGEVVIAIADQGPGIPADQLDAVTKPFYRLETSRNRLTGGSGLGLYIARDLVSRQGGKLTLSNRPQGGLLATITLPEVQ